MEEELPGAAKVIRQTADLLPPHRLATQIISEWPRLLQKLE